MYLTRIELNPARRGYRHLAASPNRLHAVVESAFPRTADAPGRRLWRLDETPIGSYLYVQSPLEPDLTHLVEQAGWPTKPDWTTRPLAPLLDVLAPGQSWAFRLAANPVRSGRVEPGADTQRLGHVSASQQIEWLLQRSRAWGFAIPDGSAGQPDVMLTRRTVQRFRRNGAGQVTLSVAVYEGRLVVDDADGVRASLQSGMGHAKAYGCGLMTLAR